MRTWSNPSWKAGRSPGTTSCPSCPAGTSRYRDMSYIGAQLPVYDAAKCIACGLCTASCPDSALISTVTDRPVDEAARATSRSSRTRPRASPGNALP